MSSCHPPWRTLAVGLQRSLWPGCTLSPQPTTQTYPQPRHPHYFRRILASGHPSRPEALSPANREFPEGPRRHSLDIQPRGPGPAVESVACKDKWHLGLWANGPDVPRPQSPSAFGSRSNDEQTGSQDCFLPFPTFFFKWMFNFVCGWNRGGQASNQWVTVASKMRERSCSSIDG